MTNMLSIIDGLRWLQVSHPYALLFLLVWAICLSPVVTAATIISTVIVGGLVAATLLALFVSSPLLIGLTSFAVVIWLGLSVSLTAIKLIRKNSTASDTPDRNISKSEVSSEKLDSRVHGEVVDPDL